MKRFLLAWEMGSGLGHAAPLSAVAKGLSSRDCEVAVAASNVELCRQALWNSDVRILRAPVLPFSDIQLKYPCTYSDILHDCGYASAEKLTRAVAAWLEILAQFQPEFVLADHSPTALLACRAAELPTATLGYGFTCPPDVGNARLPSFRKEIPFPHWAASVETKVLESMNAALAAQGGAALSRVTEIFGDARWHYLQTFPELDHYQRWRTKSEISRSGYWPPVGAFVGQLVHWPRSGALDTTSTEQRVFVYLPHDPYLSELLRWLAKRSIHTVCVAPKAAADMHAEFVGTTVALSNAPVDLQELLPTCSAAVVSGGHGTVCELLTAAVPLLIVPDLLEHAITAEHVENLGMGRSVPRGDFKSMLTALDQLINDDAFRETARLHMESLVNPWRGSNVACLVDDIVVRFS